jgi:hypothetical protein
MFSGAQKVSEKAPEAAKGGSATSANAAAKRKPARKGGKATQASLAAAGVVDPLQWWGALTQQFQQIAATAMKDGAAQTAVEGARNMATGVAKEAMKTATGMSEAASGGGKKRARRTAKKPATQ